MHRLATSAGPRIARATQVSACSMKGVREAVLCPFSTASSRLSSSPVSQDAAADFAAVAPPEVMQTQWKGMKRFYTKVSVAPTGSTFGDTYPFLSKRPNPSTAATSKLQGWRVEIDGRPLRTNAANEFVLPTQALALAIAGEFAAQKEVVIPASTPLYNLASSAIDGYAVDDPDVSEDTEAFVRATRLAAMDDYHQAAVSSGAAGAPHTPAHAVSSVTGRHDSGAMTSSSGALSSTSRLRDLLLDFLETDSACFRIDVDTADPSEKLLRKRQDKYYSPLLEWWRGAYGVELATAQGFNDLEHPEAAYAVAEDFVELADPFLKSVATSLIGALKSTVITMAFLHRQIDIEAAFQAARVEEEWQIAENGFVEDGHDTARAQLKTCLASASTFLWLSPTSQPMSLPKPGAKGYGKQLKESIMARVLRVGARREKEVALVNVVKAKIRQHEAEQREEEKRKLL